MLKNHYMLLTLILAGLSILPLIVDGSEVPDLPGNGTLVKAPDLPGNGTLMKAFLPKQQLNKNMNISKISSKRRRRIIARKKFARNLHRMTVPLLGAIDRVPKILKDLQLTEDTNSTKKFNITNLIKRMDENKPREYAQLLRIFIQYAVKDFWGLLTKRKIIRVDEMTSNGVYETG